MIRYILYILISCKCIAQDFDLQWTYLEGQSMESSFDEIIETWEYYLNHPIDINDSVALNNITDLMLLSDTELKIVKTFCLSKEQYSIYQLQQAEVSLGALKRIRPFITTYLESKLQEKKSIYYMGLQYKNDPATRLESSNYLGSIYKTQFKYKHLQNAKWHYGISWEKDIGEPLYYKRYGPNNLSFSSYHKFKFGELILGKYDISIGEGLLIGSNYRINNPYFLSYQPSYMTKPCYSAKESSYFQGFSFSSKYKHYIYNSFFSWKKISGTTSLDESGLYNTTTDLEKRNAHTETIMGIQIQRSLKRIKLASSSVLYKSSLYKPQPQYFHSLYLHYNLYNLNYSSEIVSENFTKWAQLQKLNIAISKNTIFSIQYRNRQYKLLNFYQADYSAYSNSYESGIYWAVQSHLTKKLDMKIAFDDYKSNKPNTETPYQHQGKTTFLEITHKNLGHLVRIKYYFQNKNTDVEKHKIKLLCQYKLTENLELKNKLSFSKIDNLHNSSLQLSTSWKSLDKKHRLRFSYTILTGNNESIYWSAPYFYGHYNSRFISGKSSVTSLSYQSKISKQIKSGLEYIFIPQQENKSSKLSFYIKLTLKD